jgi:FKBP-type peptidyl-prolyl cis-trans isomerase FklB
MARRPASPPPGSGLEYEILTSGPATGRKPISTDEVSVSYKGTLIDGKVFDESGKNGGGPATFRVDGVIKGWTEVLQLMHEGDKWKVYIKPDLGLWGEGLAAQHRPE